MGLFLHRGASSAALAEGLAGVLGGVVDRDPFARDLVVVPARGVERWLTQRLAGFLGVGPRGTDGVCAAVDFRTPASLVSTLTGTERDDPWLPDRLAWPVLAVIDASLDEPWCRPIATHLGHFKQDPIDRELSGFRRYALARRLAGLFASYAVQRPALLDAWQAGEPAPSDLAWQPELWRRVVERVGAPTPSDRHRDALASIRRGEMDLPSRLSLFGHTRLARTEIELLDAVGEVRELHLWLPQPSAELAAALAPLVAAGPVPRREDDSVEVVAHPLLASLGRDTRELERSLTLLHPVANQVLPDPTTPESLLGWLQSDLRANRLPDAATRESRVLVSDNSVQIHSCHGVARQVEVLREVLVGLLDDDPTLQPRDIVVLCPDVETYAPLIQSAFGLAGEDESAERHPAHLLRVRLADRDLSATNPLLGVAQQLIGIAGGRARAGELLDLAAAPPVGRRFGFDDNQLETLAGWVQQAGIRWGLDAEHREPFGLSGVAQNTWRAGLDRLLVGVAAADEGAPILDVLPVDGVPSGGVDLAGRFAELIDRVQVCVDTLTVAGPATTWLKVLREGISSLTSVPVRDAWQVAEFERALGLIADENSGADEVTVQLADVRQLLRQRLAGKPTRSNFRTGALTVCTMVPMRSVPHRVVCLLGLDDRVFPRSTTVDGDDVLARDPMTGERDPRSEDRQLLLDALLSAGEKVVITYTGRSEINDQPRQPAVPLGELIDALDRTAAGRVRDRVVRQQPLHAFSDANFTGSDPFSFDRAGYAGAEARRDQRVLPSLAGSVLPGIETDEVSLEELTAFWRDPARAFLRARDIAIPFDEEPPSEAIPIDPNGLEKWAIGDRVLTSLVRGEPAEAVARTERLRGTLPPGDAGAALLDGILDVGSRLVERSAADRVGEPAVVDVDINVAGTRLAGSVADVHAGTPVSLSYSSMGARPLAAAWVGVLALAVQFGEPVSGVVIARWGRAARRVALGPITPEDAAAHLAVLLDLRREGLARLLPLPLKTGLVVQRKNYPPKFWAARDEWEGKFGSPVPGERDDASWVQVYGEKVPFQRLLDDGIVEAARKVWDPLLPLMKGQF